MPSSSALLLWLFFRSALLPHEPASVVIPAGELPSARSAYGWLETSAPQIISDRFDSGGLTIGAPARIGVHGTSAADTTYRVNDLDATSTLRPGMPMVLPDVVGAAAISVTRLASDISMSAPGPVIDWQPMAGNRRALIAETFFMPSALAIAPNATGARPVQAMSSLADGSLLLSGELVPGKSNAMLAAHWARAERFERTSATAVEATQLSMVGHLTFNLSTTDTMQATLIAQRAAPATVVGQTATTDSYGTAQLSWRRVQRDGASYHLVGGYQWTDTTPAALAARSMDSALDGAVFPALFRPAGKEDVLRVSADVALGPRSAFGLSHQLQAWGSFDRSAMTPSLAAATSMAETVNGVAARVWRVDVPATLPSWHVSTGALFANDRIGSKDAWVEVGVRAESMQAANGGASSIGWSNVYPHAAFDLFSPSAGVGIYGTYTRAGARLPAMTLAYGDVNAPTARVYRWVDTNGNGVVDGAEGSAASSLVARVGPGAVNGLTAVDPALTRPVIDLFMGGIRFDTARFALSATAIARKEREFVRAVADGGATYTTVTQADPNADFTNPSDDRPLAAFSRNPSSFGLDHYTLTNPTGLGEGSSYTLDISAQYRSARTRLAFSAAAVKAMGTSASRGFRADANDAGLIGDVPADPNATSFAATGRTFFDRGYVGKILGVFTLPGQASLGIVTRYQDGQPFSRLAIFSTLSQGPEAVVAYANGRPTRFTYISTTDLRLQKALTFGSGQLTLIIDAFNVFNIGREVEERVVTNATFRAVSAIEPPRTIRVGLRFTF